MYVLLSLEILSAKTEKKVTNHKRLSMRPLFLKLYE